MRVAFFYLALVATFGCLAAGAAQAHPHVWVTMTEELLYAADGTVTGVRHAWTFDDMFSAFATQGLEQKTKGTFTREELAPARQGQRRIAQGLCVFHLRQGERESAAGCVRRAGRLLARLRSK
jgi:hypothetical protein